MKQKMWRSLEEWAAAPEFERWRHREFPQAASEWTNEMQRRDFLRLMGASLALGGLGACTKQPIEKIVPYVNQPEQVVPGKPRIVRLHPAEIPELPANLVEAVRRIAVGDDAERPGAVGHADAGGRSSRHHRVAAWGAQP